MQHIQSRALTASKKLDTRIDQVNKVHMSLGGFFHPGYVHYPLLCHGSNVIQ